MTLVGLDLNATRARAVRATVRTPLGLVAQALPLEDTGSSLPLALHLELRQPTVGSHAARLARQQPHLVCDNFLPHLGTPRQWTFGRHKLDAAAALRLVFEALGVRFGPTEAVAAVLPEYLSGPQVAQLAGLTHKLKWKLLGSVPVGVGATLAAHAKLPWSGSLLVVDADDHALSCSAVVLTPERATWLTGGYLPTLGLGTWMRRLLDGTAQRCIRLSRRDPRDCPAADQDLYLQLRRLIDKPPSSDDLLSLVLNTAQWSQHLMIRPSELTGFCVPLLQQALQLIAQVNQALLGAAQAGPLAGVILTPLAAGLPGLRLALERSLVAPPPEPTFDDDLGAGLLEADGLAPRVHVLGPDDLAQAAAGLAELFRAGRVAQGHRDTVPLLRPHLDDVGPPRVHFAGRDYQLGPGVFTLGRSPDCSLSFPADPNPCVSAHHCDILLDQRSYLLRDHSRYGTLVNDRLVRHCLQLHSGDRIRLGPQGPVVQFFGRM